MQEREQVHMIDTKLAQALRLVEGAVSIVNETEKVLEYCTDAVRADNERRLTAAMHRLNGYLSGAENVTMHIADWCRDHPQPGIQAPNPALKAASDEVRFFEQFAPTTSAFKRNERGADLLIRLKNLRKQARAAGDADSERAYTALGLRVARTLIPE